MNSKWQRSGGQWRNVEEYEEKIINDAMSKRQTVISERHLIYEGDSKRPSKIRITVVGGGKRRWIEFLIVRSKILMLPLNKK